MPFQYVYLGRSRPIDAECNLRIFSGLRRESHLNFLNNWGRILARFIEINAKGKDQTCLPLLLNTDHIGHVTMTPSGGAVVSFGAGQIEAVETFDQIKELLKEPELVEGLSIVDQVWPSCLKDPSAG